MRRKSLLVTVMATVVVLTTATPAHAQDPAGCLGNRMQLDIFKDRTYIRDGELINYWVSVRNDAASACTVSSANLRLQLPDSTGEPSAASTLLSLPDQTFAFPSGLQTLGPYAYRVNFGPTPPARYTARVSILNARLRDIPPPYSVLNIDRTLQTITVQPQMTIDKVGSTLGGPAPQTVTYTYTVRNTTKTVIPIGDDATEMRNVTPKDDRCSPLALQSGDSNGDHRLQLGETWTYTCTSRFDGAGSYTNTVKVCADNVIDNYFKEYCSPPDTWTVTVTPPPPVPQGAVKPVSAQQLPCTLSTPKRIKLRAKELTTIRVRTRSIDAGSKVTIRLPGGKKVTEKVGKNGIALFHVRPPKSGSASIRAAECSDVQKLSVRPARKVVTRRVPRVTG
jgi:hypothetical protein